MRTATALLVIVGLAAAPAAHAKIVKPTMITASSTEPAAEGVNYEASNVGDGKAATVWVEGDDGSGLGAWVQLDLDGEQTVDSLRVWNGNWYTWDFWNRHNRIKEIEVEFSDGSKEKFDLKDEFKAELITLPKPVKTSYVKLKIKSVYAGTTFNDSCLSEVQIMNAAADDFIRPARFKASSIYPADGDGNYEVVNTTDGLLDSMWCEGNKAGDGTGEWIEYDFGADRRVSKLAVRNGNAYSFALNLKSNRAKTATLTFSDGSKENIELKPSMVDQVIEFPPHTTRSVRITFNEVVKGKEYNDLCISEALFME